MSKARELSQRAGVDGALSNRNKVINGSFRVDQRNSGAAVTLQSGYTVDRFRVHGPVANMFTVQKQSVGVRVTRNSSGANFGHFGTPLEQQDMLPYVGQEVTVSFKARGSGTIAQQFNAVDTPSATSGTATLIAEALPYNVTTSWQRFSFTFTMPSSLSYACVYISLAQYGDAFMSNGAWIEFDEVQLEVGDTATPFEHRSFGQELSLCQRFYQKTFRYDVQPAVGNTSYYVPANAWAYASNDAWVAGNTSFITPMRTSPSLTVYSQQSGATTGQIGVFNGSNWFNATASTHGISDNAFLLAFNPLATGSKLVAFNYTADAEL